MTEKEKSQLGLLYNANYDEELIEEREALIKTLLGKTITIRSCFKRTTQRKETFLHRFVQGIM
ncbi:hypothetical protein [Paenibacillus polymyxa]|uniref:hypothetical protein n=1 Tax=Paenibacillus polymyxa TaxID=1406 RepID=UPI0021E3885C|nr:hypothetical protein [Paenibacillus polymyxa]